MIWQFIFVSCRGHGFLVLIFRTVCSTMLKPTLQGTVNKNKKNNIFENILTATCFCHSRHLYYVKF